MVRGARKSPAGSSADGGKQCAHRLPCNYGVLRERGRDLSQSHGEICRKDRTKHGKTCGPPNTGKPLWAPKTGGGDADQTGSLVRGASGSFSATQTLEDVESGLRLSARTWGLSLPSRNSTSPSSPSHGQGGTKERRLLFDTQPSVVQTPEESHSVGFSAPQPLKLNFHAAQKTLII